MGNRERIAILRTGDFKYPRIRITENWSGKTGQLVSRSVMVADHVLLVPKPGADVAVLEQLLLQAGFSVRERLPGNFLLTAFGEDFTGVDQLPAKIATLNSWHHLVASAEPDYLIWPSMTPTDPDYAAGRLWGLHNPGTLGGHLQDADIDAPEAWDTLRNAPTVVVAIVDSGIRHDHEDIAANLWVNIGEIPGDGIDNDNNGVIDDIHGCDAVSDGGNPTDSSGHGTHVAGIIGARGNNNIGTTGVAWQVKLMDAKFLGAQGGTTSDAIKAINYARRNGANIINASWDGGAYSQALREAINQCAVANIAVVTAAGNDGSDNDSIPKYPSCYDSPNIISVCATDANNQLLANSCFGRDSVDLAAPGWQIWSCGNTSASDYQYRQGTSMAAAHVSGALALARSRYPSDTIEQLIARVVDSAEPLAALQGKTRCGGRLNLYSLLNSASPSTNDMFDQPFQFVGSYGTWSGSNTGATREANEHLWYGIPGERTLWYRWQPSLSGVVELNCLSLGADVRVAVYEGDTRGALYFRADSASNDPIEPNLTKFFAEQGKTYRIIALSSSTGGERFSLSLNAVGRNDAISSSTIVTGEVFSISDSNRSATSDYWERAHPHADAGAGKSMWYSWQAPFSGTFTLNTRDSGFDTVLAVYQGTIAAPWTMQEVAANDDVDSLSRWSACAFQASQGVVYHIVVDSAHGTPGGAIRLTGQRPTPAAITEQPASQSKVAGDRAVFTVRATGSAPFDYQWFRNGSPITGAVENSLVLDPVNASDFASYQVTVRNAFAAVASNQVYLIESATAPAIRWTSGGLAVTPGIETTLSIQATGSAPLTYQWSRGGVDISGANSPSLTFASPQEADTGVYQCTVGNALGSARASLEMQVVPSPWRGWQWRRDGFPHAPISDMKVIGNQCVAVSGDRLFVSADAQTWKTVLLPENFYASSIAALGSNWICTGEDRDGNSRVVTSADGLAWAPPTAVLGVVPLGTESTVIRQVEVVAGRFVGFNGIDLFSQTSRDGGRIHYSTDGINWAPATATYLDGTTGAVSSVGRLSSDGAMMIVPSVNYNATYPTRILRTTDGMAWTEISTNGKSYHWDIDGLTYHAGGVWHFHMTQAHHSSVDGLNWQPVNATIDVRSLNSKMRVVSIASQVFWYSLFSQIRAWGDPNTVDTYSNFLPSDAPYISAAVEFQGKLVYGTTAGALGTAGSLNECKPPTTGGGALSDLGFFNGEFIATGSKTIVFSGDGTHWTPGGGMDVPLKKITGYAAQRYYTNSGTPYEPSGYLPDALTDTHISPPYSIADNGAVIMAVNYNGLVRSSDRGVTWTTLATPPFVNSASSVSWVVDRWFLTRAAATAAQLATPYLYHSTDGLSWTAVNTVNALRVTKLGSKWYAMGDASASTIVWESGNGTTWTPLTTNGLPATFSLRKLLTFNNALVAFMTSNQAYYSQDGRNWLRANLPGGVINMETALGKLVVLTSSGALCEAGPAHSGKSAPVVEVDYPAPGTLHLAGSSVEITGSFSDPDGQPVTLSYSVNGVATATQNTAGKFRFRLDVASNNVYAIRLRAVDSEGLVTSKSLRITPFQPSLPNLFSSVGEGRSFLNATRLLEFNGVVYAAGAASLWRSLDGGSTWQQVPIPSPVGGSILGFAAGNGALVLQLGTTLFATSRNGMDWQAISIPRTTSENGQSTHLPLRFESGWFVASFTEGFAATLLTSRDGISWQRSHPNGTLGYSSWISIDETGSILISPTVSIANGLLRSEDFGSNWTPFDTFRNVPAPKVLRLNGLNLAFSGARTWTSANGNQWTERYTFGSNIQIRVCGDRFFANKSTESTFSHVSSDGVNWQPLTGSKTNTAFLAGSTSVGFLSSNYGVGSTILWSASGVTWQALSNGPVDIRSTLVRDEGLLAVDGMGAVWHSPNGISWTKRLPGRTAPNMTYASTTAQPSVVSFGSRLLTGGSGGVLHLASDDLSTWTPATLGGTTISTSNDVSKVISNGTRLLALVKTRYDANTTGIYRSTNGIAWTKPTQPATTNTLRAVADNGGTSLIACGTGGLVWKSTDDGLTWSQVTVSGLVEGQAVIWFNTRWIMLGTDSADYGAPLKVFHSTNGTNWTKGNSVGMASLSIVTPNLLSAHGRLVCSMNYNPVTSTDGLTWTAMTPIKTTGSSYSLDMVPTASGWLALLPTASTTVLPEMWIAPSNGSKWTSIQPLQDQMTGLEKVDNRIFLIGPGFLKEWTDTDFSIEQTGLAEVTCGVGDTLACTTIIRNRGMLSSTASVTVEGWLSKDGFFGDQNDIWLGRVPVGVTLPAPGAQATVDLNFELPGTIRPGAMRLILRLDPESKLYENSLSNNVHISPTPRVVIPGRRLNLVPRGNGLIKADDLMEYFPHKARVSLVAQSGKGSRFTGWEGDVPPGSNLIPQGRSTPLNENFIILDADKTVIANFEADLKLSLTIRGGGTVSLDSPTGLYPAGSSATLHATPLAGWTFIGWSGALGTTDPEALLTMDTDKSITARFTMTQEEWKLRSFTVGERANPDVSGPDADPDNDGVPNWREWLHGSDPKNSAITGCTSLKHEGTVFTLQYTRMEAMPSGHAIRGVLSGDLADWSLPLDERVIARANGVETIEVRFDSTTRPKAFFRISSDHP